MPGLTITALMVPEPHDVMVFKTTIANATHKGKVLGALRELEGVYECTVDIDDRDRVLRIIGDVSAITVMATVLNLGFWIEEMED